MSRPRPDMQPVHQAFEHVNALASAVGIVPGLLGLRQVSKDTFSLLLDTKIIHDKKGGRDNITYSMIDLRVDVNGNWFMPVLGANDEVIDRTPVNLAKAAKFGAPYIKANMAKQKSTFHRV